MESFLEDINNVLNTGEVPNLFAKDEIAQIAEAVTVRAKKAGINEGAPAQEKFKFFVQECRKYLHCVLCMSPVGDAFRERLRKFPSLVNCCTIDWFSEWPADALQEVAKKQMESEKEMDDEVKRAWQSLLHPPQVHRGEIERDARRAQAEKLRHAHQLPGIRQRVRALLTEKRAKIGGMANKLREGHAQAGRNQRAGGGDDRRGAGEAGGGGAGQDGVRGAAGDHHRRQAPCRRPGEAGFGGAAKIGRDAEEANAIAAECGRASTRAMPR